MFETMFKMFMEKMNMKPDEFRDHLRDGFYTVRDYRNRMVRIETKLDLLLGDAGMDVEKIDADIKKTLEASNITASSPEAGHA